jgi:hypothetical protein
LLGCVQLPGEEGKGLPSVVDSLLQHGTHGGCGGVRDECKWRVWVGCDSSMACDKLALHVSKALWRSAVQVIG